MKIYLRSLIAILCLLSFLIHAHVKSQDLPAIPGGKKLSFNGTFTSDDKSKPGIFQSDNKLYRMIYTIGKVTDENKELLDVQFLQEDELLYEKDRLPGSDVSISNSGYTVVYDMQNTFKAEVLISVFSRTGDLVFRKNFKYASVFGFSENGNLFGAGTDKNLHIIDLTTLTKKSLTPCSKFSFSGSGSFLVTAHEDELNIYKNYRLLHTINTGLFYPRAVAIDEDKELLAIT